MRRARDGDRYSCNYDIWGYGGSPVQNILYGYYNDVNGQVTWNTHVTRARYALPDLKATPRFFADFQSPISG